MCRPQLTALLLVACFGAARADDLWATATAERRSDGWKIIHRYIDKLEDPTEKAKYPIAVSFTWHYDGPNGLPAKPQSNAAYQLEDFLDKQIERRGEGKLSHVSTGNNLRTWIYYVKSEAVFRRALTEAAKSVRLEVQVTAQPDPKWALLEAFKERVQRP